MYGHLHLPWLQPELCAGESADTGEFSWLWFSSGRGISEHVELSAYKLALIYIWAEVKELYLWLWTSKTIYWNSVFQCTHHLSNLCPIMPTFAAQKYNVMDYLLPTSFLKAKEDKHRILGEMSSSGWGEGLKSKTPGQLAKFISRVRISGTLQSSKETSFFVSCCHQEHERPTCCRKNVSPFAEFGLV